MIPSSQTVSRYIVSTLVTFAAGFAIVVAPALDDGVTLASIQDGTVIGILFSGARAGIKMVLESLITWYASR